MSAARFLPADADLHMIDEPVRRVLLPTNKPSQLRHGANQSTAYGAWCRMMQRCRNHRFPQYPRYGGRGVTIAFRWLSFAGFLADMGHAPPGGRLARIDERGNFEPGNCEWRAQPRSGQ